MKSAEMKSDEMLRDVKCERSLMQESAKDQNISRYIAGDHWSPGCTCTVMYEEQGRI